MQTGKNKGIECEEAAIKREWTIVSLKYTCVGVNYRTEIHRRNEQQQVFRDAYTTYVFKGMKFTAHDS